MALQRTRRPVAASCVAACLALAAAGSAAHAGDLFDEIYRKGAPLERSLATVSARFVETTTSTLLTAPLVSRGTLIARRPDQVRLDYTGTDARTVVIAGGVLALDWPRRGLRESRDIRVPLRRAERFLNASSPDELRRHFDIVAVDATDRPTSWQVTFTPKRRQLRDGVTRVRLWIDQASLLLQAMQMDYPGGDTTLMEFADMRINPPLDRDAFTLPAAR